MPKAVGQLNMYLNYYAAEINVEHDNPPIGIILCTDQDSVAAEYALGGPSNKRKQYCRNGIATKSKNSRVSFAWE